MKIIFLDIDGVLCTPRSHLAYSVNKNSEWKKWDPTSAALIARVCQETGAKLVISSTWRLPHHRSELFESLVEYGLTKYVFGDLSDDKSGWLTPDCILESRGYEIRQWVERFKPSTYLIVDDNLDFDSDQNYLITDASEGFGAKDYRYCLKFLGELSKKTLKGPRSPR